MPWRQKRALLIEKLQQKLHLDVRFYGKSFSLMGLAYSSSVVRGVATTFLMARWLPEQALGQFRYLLALFGIAGLFSLTGMNSGIIRGISQGDTVVARAALKRIMLISPLGSLMLLIASAERLWHGESLVATGLALTAVAFPFYSACGLYGAILTGKQEIKRLIIFAIANNLIFAAAFAPTLYTSRRLMTIVIAYFGFDIILRGSMTIVEFRRLKMQGDAREHLRLGDHLSAIGVFQVIASQLDSILIQRFAGYGSLAQYSIATVIPEQIKDLVNSMSGILLQRFSRHKSSDSLVKETRRHFWMSLSLSAGIVVVYAATAPILLPWLFPNYQNQIIPSIVYAIGLIALPAIVGVNFFQAHHQIRSLWKFSITGSVVQVVSNLALIPFFGAWGAIVSRLLTRLVGLPLSYPRIEKEKVTEA